MGAGRFSAEAYASYSSTTRGKRTEEIYTSRGLDKTLDPKGVAIRELRDSTDNPNSTPLIVAIDVTGSMGMIADVIARKGLGTLFEGILDRRPISDPHVMFMAIGDANYDHAPLQVSQFEADKRIIEQLAQIYLENGGGGNDFESYNLAWYFAAMHTVHDSMEKRGKRGYLFTIGDEQAPEPLTKAQIKQFVGDDIEREMSTKELLELVQRNYDVFHIIIAEGNHAHLHLSAVQDSWRSLLGQRVITLADHTKLAETIVSAIEVAEGMDAEKSAEGWDGLSSRTVHDAVRGITKGVGPKLIGTGSGG